MSPIFQFTNGASFLRRLVSPIKNWGILEYSESEFVRKIYLFIVYYDTMVNKLVTTGLDGPYKLDNETIDKIVTKKSAGAYALGNLSEKKGFIPKYVGRSDDDVNGRLKEWVSKGYTHFKFKYYGSPKAAFEKECNLYHD